MSGLVLPSTVFLSADLVSPPNRRETGTPASVLFNSKLRSFQALWETDSVFKRARNLWIRGLGSSLRQAAATVQAAALLVK